MPEQLKKIPFSGNEIKKDRGGIGGQAHVPPSFVPAS